MEVTGAHKAGVNRRVYTTLSSPVSYRLSGALDGWLWRGGSQLSGVPGPTPAKLGKVQRQFELLYVTSYTRTGHPLVTGSILTRVMEKVFFILSANEQNVYDNVMNICLCEIIGLMSALKAPVTKAGLGRYHTKHSILRCVFCSMQSYSCFYMFGRIDWVG